MSETTRLTGTYQGRCSHGVVLTATCDDCQLAPAPQPAPDAGGEWKHSGRNVLAVSALLDPKQKGRVVAIGRKTVATAESEEYAAQIVSDHNAIPKLVVALEDMIDLWKRGQKIINGQTRDVEYDSQVIAARAALALVKGRE